MNLLQRIWPFRRPLPVLTAEGLKKVAPPVPGKENRKLAIGTMVRTGESGKPRYTVWTNEAALQLGLKVCQWVYTCCRAYADNMAQVPWIMEKREKGDWNEIEGGAHWAWDRFQNPNRHMSGSEMIERQAYHMLLAGNMITDVIDSDMKNRKDPTLELWPIDPDRVSPIPDEDDYLEGYEIRKKGQGRGQGRPVSPLQIVHSQFINAGDPYWGLAPLEAGARTVDTEVAALAWNLYQLKNRATGSLAFSTDHDLEEDAYNTLKERIHDQHVGVENAGLPWILTNGAKLENVSTTNTDMDWIDGKKLNAIEICAVFRTPPPVVGILDASTYNNMALYMKAFWTQGVLPLLTKMRDSYNRCWVWPRWGPDVRLNYDTSMIEDLKRNWTETLLQAEAMMRLMIPLEVINDALELGLPIEKIGAQAKIGWCTSGLIPAVDAMISGEILSGGGPDGEEPPMPDAGKLPAITGDTGAQQGQGQGDGEDPMAAMRATLDELRKSLTVPAASNGVHT